MILATLAIKAYAGKSKINSVKKVTSSGEAFGTRTPLVAHLVLHSHGYLTELTWQVLREGKPAPWFLYQFEYDPWTGSLKITPIHASVIYQIP